LRDVKKDELILQKEKQLDCEMAVDEDLSDGKLDAMDEAEDIEQVTKKQVIARLFGDDSDEDF